MSADRMVFMEHTSTGEFVRLVVTAASHEPAFRRNTQPGNVVTMRPAQPGESTMSLVNQLADATREATTVVRRFNITIPIRQEKQ